jgi:tetratricopeptide (TPR) repeat protein
VPGVLVSELNKTPAQLKAKFERDRVALEQHTVANPKDPRWWYYLGATYSDLSDMAPTGEREELRQKAVVAFGRCQQLRGWNEESAWACYRGADMLCKLGQYQEAVEWCAKGLARHAGIAELAWLAAYASWQRQDPEQAVQWAHMAIPNGLFITCRTDYPGRFRAKRIGFRNVGALWEGPFDILRFALRKVGDNEGADAAEELYKEALRQRTDPQS